MHGIARLLTIPAVLAAVLLGLPGSGAPEPRVLAALGDSITQAANVCCRPGSYPEHSWATGGSGSDGVLSYYERLAARQPLLRRHNDSANGARARDLPGQAVRAVAQQADYVTVLIGANDLCAPSAAAMTSPAGFAAAVGEALDILDRGLPQAGIYVASIPDLHRLWSVLHTDPRARRAWAAAGTCPSLLGPDAAGRQAVAGRERIFNDILARSCARHPRCRWDGGAVYRYPFPARLVSTVDYFHPGPGGQAALARLAWEAFARNR